MSSVYDIFNQVTPLEIVIGLTILIAYLERRNLARSWQSIKRFLNSKGIQ